MKKDTSMPPSARPQQSLCRSALACLQVAAVSVEHHSCSHYCWHGMAGRRANPQQAHVQLSALRHPQLSAVSPLQQLHTFRHTLLW